MEDEPTIAEAVATAVKKGRVWLTTEDLAQRFRTTANTVRYWRMAGVDYGPQGVKVGRRVLYDLAEVERWEAEQVDKATA
jgi:hypothetical protein